MIDGIIVFNDSGVSFGWYGNMKSVDMFSGITKAINIFYNEYNQFPNPSSFGNFSEYSGFLFASNEKRVYVTPRKSEGLDYLVKIIPDVVDESILKKHIFGEEIDDLITTISNDESYKSILITLYPFICDEELELSSNIVERLEKLYTIESTGSSDFNVLQKIFKQTHESEINEMLIADLGHYYNNNLYK